MSEKGGKGFSMPPKPSKSSFNPSTKTKGSSDFNSNFSSPKSDGKFATPTGGMSKGGKGANAAKGGKTPVVKEAVPNFRVEQELPQNAKCLLDCEVANILQGIQEKMVLLSADPDIKLPVSFDNGMMYAKTGSFYTDPASVKQVLDPLTKYGVANSEICMIAKVCPETVEEAFALIPSLEANRSMLTEPLEVALGELAKLNKSA